MPAVRSAFIRGVCLPAFDIRNSIFDIRYSIFDIHFLTVQLVLDPEFTADLAGGGDAGDGPSLYFDNRQCRYVPDQDQVRGLDPGAFRALPAALAKPRLRENYGKSANPTADMDCFSRRAPASK